MNDQQPPYIAFALGVVSSIVGSLLLVAGSWMVSQSWFIAGLAAAAWLCLTAGMTIVFRRSYRATLKYELRKSVTFVRPMTQREATKRIRSAQEEIWSFQISGSEFTAHSTETYESWLEDDKNRRLRIAFANPEKTDLLKNIVSLSGVDKMSTPDHAYEHLRELARKSRDKYVTLREEFPERVDVRVYDFSPPYSIHAIDPNDGDEPAGSVFVELYLPDLRSSERPCMLLQQDHASFLLYRNQSLKWFQAATPVGATP